MVQTRGQLMRTTQGVMQLLASETIQKHTKRRKHFAFYSNNKTLVLVSISKTEWGLVLIDEHGQPTIGQFVRHKKVLPHCCAFDGEFFYWEMYEPHTYSFICGKSIAPFFTAVEPVVVEGGWTRRSWPFAGGAHDIMWDLTSIRFKPLRAPYDQRRL